MSKITETDILDIKSKLSKLYPLQKLCLVIHPSKEQELIDIIDPQKLSPRIYKNKPIGINSIFGMNVYKDKDCNPNFFHIIPELQYQNLRKTLL